MLLGDWIVNDCDVPAPKPAGPRCKCCRCSASRLGILQGPYRCPTGRRVASPKQRDAPLLRTARLAPSECLREPELWKYLPRRLSWLRRGLEEGFFSRHHCRWCAAALEPWLAEVDWHAWHGVGVDGLPCRAGPPGGWKNARRPVPPHGNACLSSYSGGSVQPDAFENANQRLFRQLRQAQKDPAERWAQQADGSVRLRTELLPDEEFRLSPAVPI